MRRVLCVIIALIAVFAIVAVTMYVAGDTTSAPKSDLETNKVPKEDGTPGKSDGSNGDIACDMPAASGRYTAYSAKIIDDNKGGCAGYVTTILFFHAPWCPECRAFEKAIQSGEIPGGVQILKVDYDSNKDLRKKYGVTIQTSFVRIDDRGNKVLLWSGYGKDKSIQTILSNTNV